MRIAILGAGRVGGTLGRRLADAGHTVVYGLRPGRDGLPVELRGERAWAAAEAALAGGGDFGGKPLFDTTNPT